MRRRDPAKLQTIAAAALRVFGRQGFEGTQMSEVAIEAGVSVGTLYTYVENKEALLLVSVLGGLGDLPSDAQPFAVPDRDRMIAELRATVRGRITLSPPDVRPTSSVHAVRRAVGTVVGEVFDLLATTRHAADAFERCAADAPDLAEVFYVDARGRLIDQLTTFVSSLGPLTPSVGAVPPVMTARHIVETVTWLARHRHHDRTFSISDSEARQLAVDLLTPTLTGGRR